MTLLSSAVELLKERGVEGLTLREIARRTGVSHGAPARHFKGLEDLLTEVAAGAFELLVATMDEQIARSKKDALEGTGLGYIAFAVRHPELFRLMFRVEKLDLNSPRLQAAKVPAITKLYEALSDAYLREHGLPISPEKLNVRVTLAWSTVHGYAAIWADEKNAKGILVDAQSLLDALRPALLLP